VHLVHSSTALLAARGIPPNDRKKSLNPWEQQ